MNFATKDRFRLNRFDLLTVKWDRIQFPVIKKTNYFEITRKLK